ncbi:hypothetical protein AB0N97_21080 [Streptomyces collinus]|uniref:hypothetical protein n=1 Tax=Streptomyces collinus TaxID=42684 RepID=UPI00342A305A
MTTVVMHNLVCLDGFIADANDDVGPPLRLVRQINRTHVQPLRPTAGLLIADQP